MVRCCIKQFPKGSYEFQKDDGFAIDKTLALNIDVYAKKIVKDMQFLGICCSSSGVRTGKSSLVSQIGAYYTEQVNKMHKLNLTFDVNNVVFKSEDLIKKAFEIPRYSCLILDEGDALVEHYASRIARDLRKFFRKSGQLNLFIILILPDFFELPQTYATSNSNFLVNVKFEGEFDRGFFEFFSFSQKKNLYLFGKKNRDWKAAPSSFDGKFPKLYAFDEKEYRERKLADLEESEDKEKNPSPKYTIKSAVKYFMGKKITLTNYEWAEAFGVSLRTIQKAMSEIREDEEERIKNLEVDTRSKKNKKIRRKF